MSKRKLENVNVHLDTITITNSRLILSLIFFISAIPAMPFVIDVQVLHQINAHLA